MRSFIFIISVISLFIELSAQDLSPIKYNNPNLIVDLGVGLWAWPLPMDYDKDGDLDLVVACPDKPYNGIYFFENPGGDEEMPVFKAGKKISKSERNLQVSVVAGEPIVLSPNVQYEDFRANALTKASKIPLNIDFRKLHERIRANQWKYVDYDGDGDQDLIMGVGDWTAYGWDDAYNEKGVWTNGPLHGYVYLALNEGTNERPNYQTPRQIEAGGKVLDVYGMPSPSFADFDQDGDLDIICGEFLDGFTYFQNIGTRSKPVYEEGKRLSWHGVPIRMDLQMITPVSVDWNKDGFADLIVGDEDGRVAFVKHTGKIKDGIPQFYPPQYFQQEADEVKFGALVTPVSYDWDADGDEDLICGNTAGYIGFIENLSRGNTPRWAAPQYLLADGRPIRPMAGPNGSIQGPCEAKWGYTTLSVADWNGDNLPDLVVNSIWGKVVWYQNIGTIKQPLFTSSRPIEVDWKKSPPKPTWNWWNPEGNELSTQWRTTPYAIDWNGDHLMDLVMLDHEGYLVFFERSLDQNGLLILHAPKRIFLNAKKSNEPLRLNERTAGKSGRRKFCIFDWDKDGRLDLLVNSKNVDFYRNIATTDKGETVFEHLGQVHEHILAGHTTSPTFTDWDKNGVYDLLIGAEDGRLYYLKGK